MGDYRKTNEIRVNCREVISLCHADCCRSGGGVALTPEEIASGVFKTEYLCIEKKELCDREEPCFHKVIQVKTKDGVCGYLGEGDSCEIYDRRPLICREYHCTATGWKKDPANFLNRESGRLSPALVFDRNPNRILRDVIIPREKGRETMLFLLIGDSTLCSDVMAGGEFDGALPEEKEIRAIYEMFDGKASIGEIETRASDMSPAVEESFRKLVTLLAGQKLLIQKMR